MTPVAARRAPVTVRTEGATVVLELVRPPRRQRRREPWSTPPPSRRRRRARAGRHRPAQPSTPGPPDGAARPRALPRALRATCADGLHYRTGPRPRSRRPPRRLRRRAEPTDADAAPVQPADDDGRRGNPHPGRRGRRAHPHRGEAGPRGRGLGRSRRPSTGEDALERVQPRSPADVVLIDIMLPGHRRLRGVPVDPPQPATCRS